MQLSLFILEQPRPERGVWEQVDQQQQRIVVEVLARLIAQAVMPHQQEEQSHE